MSNLGGDIIFLDSSEDTPPQESQLMIGQVKTQDLIFGRVFDFYNGEIIRLAAYDAIIIEMTETYLTRNLVAKIRRHLDQLVFLKPIFILVTGAVQDELLSSMADGFVKDEQEVGQLSGKVNLVLHHLASFDLGKTLPYEELRMLGFLAYIASRDLKEVTPFIDRQGIYYPILSDTAQNHFEKKHFLHALDQMEKENYLHGSFYQTTYLCSDCLGDHLLYREVCPSCKSSHLLSEEIIHHFRCAHVAPMSKFRSGNQAVSALECPKCQYELKHIGVDYDKPATMHYCQNCQSEFQQYAMMAKCTGCGRDQEVEHLIKKEINKYSITDKALNALRSGHLYPVKEPSKILKDTLPWHLFMKTIDFEQSQQGGDPNHLVMIRFHDLPGMVRQVGEENKLKLFNEIIQIVKSTQQPFDFRGAKLPRLYFTLMKTSAQDAETISQRIVFLINHLLQDNLRIKRSTVSAEVLSFDVALIETMLQEKEIVK